MSLVLHEHLAQILLELLFDIIFCSHKLRVTIFFRIICAHAQFENSTHSGIPEKYRQVL
jgi:hypothetical protein